MRCIKESRTHRNYTEGKRSSCLFKLKKKVPIYFYNIQWHFLYPRGILFRAEKKRVSLAFKKLMLFVVVVLIILMRSEQGTPQPLPLPGGIPRIPHGAEGRPSALALGGSS